MRQICGKLGLDGKCPHSAFGDLSPVALERNTCLNFANFGAKLTMALQFINCYKPRLVAFLTTLEQSLEEISPKDRPAPEKMGLGSHQRLPFLDVGRPLGTAHRMAATGVITFLRWREWQTSKTETLYTCICKRIVVRSIKCLNTRAEDCVKTFQFVGKPFMLPWPITYVRWIRITPP